MRREKVVFILLVLLGVVSAISAQGYSLGISPTSGPPGTVVNLSPNPSYGDERCFANNMQIGRSYTVPAGATGTITFYCEAGTGEFYVRTNDAVFTVTQPDGDGDGVPDGQDQCPNDPAPNTPDGCPPGNNPPPDNNNPQPQPQPQPQQPPTDPNQPAPDSDGDGIPDPQDACPNSGGVLSLNGCPEQFTLPELPDEGDCMVATSGNFRVNVRVLYGDFTPRVGFMEPNEMYPVMGQSILNGETWYIIEPGWVSETVTRTGGDNCEDVVVLGIDPFLPTHPDRPPMPMPDFCGTQPSVIVFENALAVPEIFDIYEDLGSPDPDLFVAGRLYQGTVCPEIILGNNNANVINGRGGNDLIYGAGGNDILLGMGGDDRIFGMGGDDFINGGEGDDRLIGDAGNDRIYGDAGDDTIGGGAGDDWLFGRDGNDNVSDVGGGRNRLYGEDDNDIIWYSRGYNFAYGGAGNDQIRNHDSWLGEDSVGYAYGGPDNDDIQFHPHGVDFIYGQAGNDTIRLLNGFATYYRWRSVDITEVYGGLHDDTITIQSPLIDDAGTILSDYVLYGEGGNDTITGTGDLVGGIGNDIITLYSADNFQPQYVFGGGGNDIITAVGRDTHHLYGGSGNDTINGGEGRDIIMGGSDDDTLNGNQGSDYLDGGGGDDRLSGTNSDRFLIRSDLDNYLIGGSGEDTMDGGWSGSDTCIEDSDDTSVTNCERSDTSLRASWADDLDDLDIFRYCIGVVCVFGDI